MPQKRGLSSIGRAPALQAGGRGFDSRRLHVKKLLTLILASVGGYALFKKVTAANADRDLWAEVTDAVRK